MDLNQSIDRILCWLGIHDFQVLEITFGFGEAGDVEKVECKRCELIISREKKR
tara:strand:- start:359 stop:517 length:159 start_codon:yes stop_codon:yes gene_type:complete